MKVPVDIGDEWIRMFCIWYMPPSFPLRAQRKFNHFYGTILPLLSYRHSAWFAKRQEIKFRGYSF